MLIFVLPNRNYKMNYFISHSDDPFFNIATEEFLLKEYDADFFFLYINSPALIVGKHQNTLAEINFDKVTDQKIPVIRRLSGGGTVFHDNGNLNYCFIRRGEKGKLVDFKRYCSPIIECLTKLGVAAKFEGKSDLTIGGKKFSGNASHVYKNKVMQHGTMLFLSDLKRLNELLKVNPLKFKDRGVRSIRSRVTNISEHLPYKLSIAEFAKKIIETVQELYPDSQKFALNAADRNTITRLSEEKYNNWEWNFGYSPSYQFEKTCSFTGGKMLEIEMKIEKGNIQFIQISGNCIVDNMKDMLYKQFYNQKHDKSTIKQLLNNINLQLYFKEISKSEFMQLFF